MTWAEWRAHFERNRARDLPRISAAEIPEAWRRTLSRSLARFQLGEAGEGRIARQIDAVLLPAIDADYRAALKLFVAEEGRHGRILALMVRALDGVLLRETWTARLFVHARRLLGVRFKLLVLLAAEVIGIGFYGLLAERLASCVAGQAGSSPAGPLGAALEQICADEDAHLQFHADFFRSQATSPVARLAFSTLWWIVASAAAAAVLFDHRATLAVLGVSRRGAALRLLALIQRADAEVTRARPAPCAARAAS